MANNHNTSDAIIAQYDEIQKGYESTSSSRSDWEMRDGMYVHYSAYQNEKPCFSGIGESIKAL